MKGDDWGPKQERDGITKERAKLGPDDHCKDHDWTIESSAQLQGGGHLQELRCLKCNATRREIVGDS